MRENGEGMVYPADVSHAFLYVCGPFSTDNRRRTIPEEVFTNTYTSFWFSGRNSADILLHKKSGVYLSRISGVFHSNNIEFLIDYTLYYIFQFISPHMIGIQMVKDVKECDISVDKQTCATSFLYL